MIETRSKGKLPSGWFSTSIGELTLPSKERADPRVSAELPYVGLEHIESGSGKVLGHGLSTDVRSTKTRFHPGDLLYGRLRPYLNKAYVAELAGICSTDILVFPENPCLSSKYLLFLLMSPEFVSFATQNMSGVQHPRISFKTMSRFPIPLPPLPEQRRIVAKIEELFTKLDAGVEALKKTKALLRRYRQSILKAAFEGRLTQDWREQSGAPPVSAAHTVMRVLGQQQQRKALRKSRLGAELSNLPRIPETWSWLRLGSICDVLGGFAFKSEDYTVSGNQVVRIGNVKSGRLALGTNPVFVEQVPKNLRDKYELKQGDVIITLTGTRRKRDYGHVAIVRGERGLLLNQRVARLRFRPDLSAAFFSIAMQAEHFRNQFFRGETGNVGQGNVGMNAIRESLVVSPPPAEQSEVVQRVECHMSSAEQAENTLEGALVRARILRHTILIDAFAGSWFPKIPGMSL